MTGAHTWAGLCAGDIVGMRSGGGGGWGDPAFRDPEKVLADVRDERITVDEARELYRTVIDNYNGSLVLDAERTGQLRTGAIQ